MRAERFAQFRARPRPEPVNVRAWERAADNYYRSVAEKPAPHFINQADIAENEREQRVLAAMRRVNGGSR